MHRTVYMLGYCNDDRRRAIQHKTAQYWLDKKHRVVVLDSQHTEQEFYNFMQSDVEYIHMSDLNKICRARNFAMHHATKNGLYNQLIVLADNDGALRDMSDYGVSTDDLIDAVYASDCDIIQPKRPFGFIKDFFAKDERATTHLCLTSENQFKGTVLFVRAGIDVEYDEWYDKPYETHSLTPGEDIDFCLRAKMQGYKVRFAENLVQHEISSHSTWATSRTLVNKPWESRCDYINKRVWNAKYNTKFGRKEYIKLSSTKDDAFDDLFS